MQTAIWWIRRDLRLSDNPSLSAALAEGYAVIPVFILDPNLLKKKAPNRQAFLFEGLRRLAEDLRERGSDLIVRAGPPAPTLAALLDESGAKKIFVEEDYTPYARRRDTEIADSLPIQFMVGATVHHPQVVVKADGSPYSVYTPFSKAWKALPLPVSLQPAPVNLPPVARLSSQEIPEAITLPDFPAGEREANRRLKFFLEEGIFNYADQRNRLDLPGTSALSPYLRFGMLSARTAVLAARSAMRNAADPPAQKSAETFLNELIWREFYNTILYHFPYVLKQAFNPALRRIPWRNAPQDLAAWQAGRTGIPVVDACMRQLLGLGWVHNRGRMIAASFLVKDLLIDWREGERWYMRHLVDGDPAANNGGWQWTAGVGTDAAPYFRIFNPILQGWKFDPEGVFVRRWVPELTRVPTEFIHEPWKMTIQQQQACGCVLGKDYPFPIVDRSLVKERTLEAYAASKNASPSSLDDILLDVD